MSQGKSQLTKIVQALNPLRLLFRLAQCRQKHRRQDRDDGDDDEQFDQREAHRLSTQIRCLRGRICLHVRFDINRSESRPKMSLFGWLHLR